MKPVYQSGLPTEFKANFVIIEQIEHNTHTRFYCYSGEYWYREIKEDGEGRVAYYIVKPKP